jgi:hypothetical protein
MKALVVLAASLLLTACTLTPRQRMAVVGGILLTGAIAAQQDTSPDPMRRLPCKNMEACR